MANDPETIHGAPLPLTFMPIRRSVWLTRKLTWHNAFPMAFGFD